MKLIIIFGPHAVGKMTVGQHLAKLTNIPLFHNHESIELALRLMGQDAPWGDLSNAIRRDVFEHVAKAHGKGLIFTFMWALDHVEDHTYIKSLEELFIQEGGEVYYIELCADKDVRLERNKSENRLLHKASKRDLDVSEKRFLRLEDKYRLNSYDGEMNMNNYLKIDNTHREPEEVAKMIKDYFML